MSFVQAPGLWSNPHGMPAQFSSAVIFDASIIPAGIERVEAGETLNNKDAIRMNSLGGSLRAPYFFRKVLLVFLLLGVASVSAAPLPGSLVGTYVLEGRISAQLKSPGGRAQDRDSIEFTVKATRSGLRLGQRNLSSPDGSGLRLKIPKSIKFTKRGAQYFFKQKFPGTVRFRGRTLRLKGLISGKISNGR